MPLVSVPQPRGSYRLVVVGREPGVRTWRYRLDVEGLPGAYYFSSRRSANAYFDLLDTSNLRINFGWVDRALCGASSRRWIGPEAS